MNETSCGNEASIESVEMLLRRNLRIPEYQRAYQWNTQSMEALLSDILSATNDAAQYQNFRYRMGTILLHKKDDVYDVVDGQQRILSLALLRLALEKTLGKASVTTSPILQQRFENKKTQRHFHENYRFCKAWLSRKGTDAQKKIQAAYGQLLEVVVIRVAREIEAFQLFDSQNARGKAPAPHDLLKAYHLREMKDDPYEMARVVTRWEAREPQAIEDLFNWYLFPIWNWAQGKKAGDFSARDIDIYKGIPANAPYAYAKRALRSMPYFQLMEPFISGADFFGMVEYYLGLLGDVNDRVKDILPKTLGVPASTGLGYATNLFICALLCYYDRFHDFDVSVMKMLFEWAFMLRVDVQRLGYASVNKYAIGDSSWLYSNNLPMFKAICTARTPDALSSIAITVNEGKMTDAWKKAFDTIKFWEGGIQ